MLAANVLAPFDVHIGFGLLGEEGCCTGMSGVSGWRTARHDVVDLIGIDRFVLHQRVSHCIQLVEGADANDAAHILQGQATGRQGIGIYLHAHRR